MKVGTAAILALGVTAISSMSASAAIVCKGHVCWHTQEAYEYPPSARIVVHEDNWHWGPKERYSFREHEGRGYWAGKRWTEF
jgi:hypothetical protein